MAIAFASDIGKAWAHLGPWIKDFGIQFDVTAVVSDAALTAMLPMVEAATPDTLTALPRTVVCT